MANPRAVTDYEGIGYHETTHKYDSSIVYDSTKAGGASQVGLAVSLKDDGTVGLAGDGEHVEGKLVIVERDGFCGVQDGGYTTFPGGSGATLTLGAGIMGDLDGSGNSGYIQAAASDQVGKAKGTIVDASTATAVVVNLG